ncbi:uncharacterized protein N7483_006639 [Penicillium malachiteum]|uniref:uncharacterized protein n=1 Tax=Penicillium malachiteum TaxID=1324776 RepID=UPI002546C307|nr:uncharacterized protein N7483_006639 [Penicillium malachiteum]KAJ5725282.1 hypothetical protein N7483_006639 [Penicillium malachiteum]
MTIVHIVLFKFRADTSEEIRNKFVTEIKSLKTLDCVKTERRVVGGPSITVPAEKSKGFHRAALDAYQASSEHEREDLVRFDFEVEQDDEPLLGF